MPLHLAIPLWAGQILFGWLVADAFSGLGHWWEDRCGRLDMPLLGRAIVLPNRIHHTHPLTFTHGSTLSRGLVMWVVVAIVSGVWLLLTGPNLTWATATFGGVMINEVHCWAHRPEMTPRWLRWLQEMGAIQSPKHHAGHHRAPHDRRYCILTDWLNPGLDAIGFWDRLEHALTVVGLEPNRGTA
jgi:ubiquitin-conjugating enzyme E2 variant